MLSSEGGGKNREVHEKSFSLIVFAPVSSAWIIYVEAGYTHLVGDIFIDREILDF